MKIPNNGERDSGGVLSLARIVSEDSQLRYSAVQLAIKSSKDS